MSWLRYLALALAGLAGCAVVALLLVQRLADGPLEFLQGGPFQTGEIVEGPVTDWSFGLGRPMEFELEALAREYFGLVELGPPPAQPPNDIWFFRMDPRT